MRGSSHLSTFIPAMILLFAVFIIRMAVMAIKLERERKRENPDRDPWDEYRVHHDDHIQVIYREKPDEDSRNTHH